MVDYLEDTRNVNKSKLKKTNLNNNRSTINGAHKKTTIVQVTKTSSRTQTTKKSNQKGILTKKPKKTATRVTTSTRTQTVPYKTKKITKTKAPQTRRKEIVRDISNRDIKAFEQREKVRKATIKKNMVLFLKVCSILAVLGIITYRYTLINAKLAEKESLKAELESINKENAQLQVNIESKMNINTIEQLAKELLGMQKLDNNQKVYINLDKKDYTESGQNNVLIETDTWWDKLLKTLKIK